jgi:rhomboid protease GluP
VMLLALLGFGDGQTDILAHIFGFASGLVIGLLLARLGRDWLEDRRAQSISAWSAGAIAALAWLVAILAPR